MQAVGRVAKSANGFVADVSATYVDHVLQEAINREQQLGESLTRDSIIFAGGDIASRTWVPIFHLERLPRLLNNSIGRRRQGRQVPWAKMK